MTGYPLALFVVSLLLGVWSTWWINWLQTWRDRIAPESPKKDAYNKEATLLMLIMIILVGLSAAGASPPSTQSFTPLQWERLGWMCAVVSVFLLVADAAIVFTVKRVEGEEVDESCSD